MRDIKNTLEYDDDTIQVLEGLEAVRKRPGMYIGSSDTRGLHHLVDEVVDNAVDEAMAGFGQTIDVTLHEDGSVSVQDEGRGIPVGMHRTGRPTPEVIMTVLHAGGKFGQGGYTASGGLHGVGASVVNALSAWLHLTIHRDGHRYEQRFENGGVPVTTLEKKGTTRKTGTCVRFLPDPGVLQAVSFHYETLAERLREAAFLLGGTAITFTDKRGDTSQQETFQYETGLQAFVSYLNEDKESLHEVISFDGGQQDIRIDFAFQFNDGYTENILSFVNHVRTRDGGTHEFGMKTALTRALNEHARKLQMLKTKDKNLDGNDIREGLTAVLSVHIPEALLQFEGQTKSKLGTPDARAAVDAFLSEKLGYFLEENPKLSTMLIQKAIKAQQVRETARKAREEARSGKKSRKKEALLSGKLTPAQSKNPQRNELYLVEGDSAGGSAKEGRDRKFQAVLPLRGKVINTEKAKLDDIMKNEEIRTIIYAIGAGAGTDFSIDDCNYDKIVIMTDADTDGAHIQVLLLTFFYRYMRPLVEAGKVFIALPPLYKVEKGSGAKRKMEYAWDEEGLNTAIKNVGKGYTVQRYKGLGEMDPIQLWETTMDPEGRTLIRVNVDDLARADKRVSTLMGDKVEPRRKWIESHVAFGLDEETNIMDNEQMLLREEEDSHAGS
ncbi:DNA topoisomerase IV subunit B [Natribacillus halophilus]|uniref:DNA topoisomerase 4 subunit B n=1 Tax=Natribacillus halophilus TaxID=549003 RepID=A0A1G8J7I6_9BACI|nr:DNA topoisomerase IV subunit B [Natribacillus halophilus]SDI26610.1 DNA topoisomerase IV subunit B [Natribacillus halophilus]